MEKSFNLGLDTFGDVTQGPDGRFLGHPQVLRNVVKEAVQGPPDTNIVVDGLGHYVDNFAVDQTKMISVWLPADVILFSAPMWLRLPMRHVVSFGWTAYVSFLRGGAPVAADGLQRRPTPM